MKQEILKQIAEEVSKRYKACPYLHYGPFDETFFTMKVYDWCKVISSKLEDKNIDRNCLLAAALLHDIGKTELDFNVLFPKGKDVGGHAATSEWKIHPQKSAKIARKILGDLNVSKPEIMKICYLVRNHDDRGKSGLKKTIELKILQDADLLSDEGVIGVLRTFVYGGMFKRSFIESIKYSKGAKLRLEKQGYLNLDVSKELAKIEVKKMKALIAEVSKELDGDMVAVFG